MPKNLKEAMRYKNVAIVDIANLLQVRAQTASDKINGVYDFKFGEAMAIREKYFKEYTLEYLFSEEKESAWEKKSGMAVKSGL